MSAPESLGTVFGETETSPAEIENAKRNQIMDSFELSERQLGSSATQLGDEIARSGLLESTKLQNRLQESVNSPSESERNRIEVLTNFIDLSYPTSDTFPPALENLIQKQTEQLGSRDAAISSLKQSAKEAFLFSTTEGDNTLADNLSGISRTLSEANTESTNYLANAVNNLNKDFIDDNTRYSASLIKYIEEPSDENRSLLGSHEENLATSLGHRFGQLAQICNETSGLQNLTDGASALGRTAQNKQDNIHSAIMGFIDYKLENSAIGKDQAAKNRERAEKVEALGALFK